jgi:cytochrome c
LVGVAFQSFAQVGPYLGLPATSEQISQWDVDIESDGSGLPPGSGSVTEGKIVYEAQCLVCHGSEGQHGMNDRLVGGQGSLNSAEPVKTIGSFWPYATTIFDYVRRAMPYTQPQSLTDDQVYAVSAYLLYLNGIIDDDTVVNAQTLPDVQMPNRDNFVRAIP